MVLLNKNKLNIIFISERIFQSVLAHYGIYFGAYVDLEGLFLCYTYQILALQLKCGNHR